MQQSHGSNSKWLMMFSSMNNSRHILNRQWITCMLKLNKSLQNETLMHHASLEIMCELIIKA